MLQSWADILCIQGQSDYFIQSRVTLSFNGKTFAKIMLILLLRNAALRQLDCAVQFSEVMYN